MKKIITLLLFGCLSATFMHGQSISNYTFTATNPSSTFTYLSGATSVASLTSGSVDDGYVNSVPIGFNFVYMGNIYTTVGISTNGWIGLGGALTANTAANGLTSSGTPRPVLAPLWDDNDVQLSTNISYLTSGTAPNRIFTIECKNVQWRYDATGNTLSYQVVLSEADGIVTYIYKDEGGTVVTTSASVGITGVTTGSGTFRSVNVLTTAATSSTTTETTTISVKPPTGLTFTFTPPASVPDAPTSVNFSAILATSMTLSWTDNATTETGYVVQRSTDNVTFTTTGTTAANVTTLAQTGLSAATTYYFRVFAVNEGRSSGSADGSQLTSSAVTYVWQPMTGTTSFATAANWLPVRTTPDATDVLEFSMGGTSIATGVTAQTVAKIIVKTNTNTTLQSSAAVTLTVAGGTGTDVDVQSGSTLVVGNTSGFKLTMLVSASNTIDVAGTLTIQGDGSATLLGELSSGASTSMNVSGTVNNKGTLAPATLTFAASSNYNHQYTTAMGAIPTATWNASSTATISSLTNPTAGSWFSSGGAQTFGNFTWNTPSLTTIPNMSGAVLICTGTFTMTSTNSASIRMGASSSGTITTVNFTQTGGTIDMASGTGNGTINCSGTFNQSAGTITETGTGTTNTIIFNGAAAQTVTLSGTTSNSINFRLNNALGVTLTGTVTINSAAKLTFSAGTFTGGAITYNATTSTLEYAQTTGVTTTDLEFPSMNGPTALIINNAGGVALHAPRTVTTGFTLTAGILTTTTTNFLTLGTAVASVTGTASAYVNGPLAWQVNGTGLSRTFPIGNSTSGAGGFKPFVLLTFTAGTTQTITAQDIAGATGGTGSSFSLTNVRYYRIQGLSGLTLTSTTCQITYTTGEGIVTASKAVIGQSATAAGTYANRGQSANSASLITSNTGLNSDEYFVIGSTENVWTGTGNWSTDANWSSGAAPTCASDASISSGTVTVDVAGATAKSVIISSGATLVISSSSNALNVGTCTDNTHGGASSMTINGTLTVSDGNLKVNGNLAFATGSTFNMSGGTIEIDGNSGISGTSVAAATPLFAFGILSGTTITTTATAGTIKITDPHFVATSSTSNGIAFQGYLGTAAAFTGTNSLVLGDQTSTDASTAVDGFKVDTYVGGARLALNNVTVDGGTGTSRFACSPTGTTADAFDISGNLTVTLNSTIKNLVGGSPIVVAGDITNNGTVTIGQTATGKGLALGLGSGTSLVASTKAQTISGSGTLGTISTLLYNNTNAAGITSNINLAVGTILEPVAGFLNMGANTITLGISTASVGTLNNTGGRIVGKFKRWKAASTAVSLTFPIGTTTATRTAVINHTTAPTTGGTLTAQWVAGDPGFSNPAVLTQGAITIDDTHPAGAWQIDAADAFAGGTYTATFTFGSVPNPSVNDFTKLVLLKRAGTSGDWSLDGTHVTTSGSNATPVLSRTLITSGFSQFAVGSPATVLAVEFTNINAQAKGTMNVINFSTATEKDVKEFAIERSVNNRTWEVMGTLAAIGGVNTTHYSFNDVNPTTLSYYRVRSVETNGKDQVSKIVAVKRNGGKLAVNMVSPVPTTEGVNVDFSTSKIGTLNVVITDIVGKVVRTERFTTVEGANLMRLNLSNLAQGSYILSLNDGETIATQRIVKQ